MHHLLFASCHCTIATIYMSYDSTRYSVKQKGESWFMRVLLSYFKYKATHASDGLLLYALVLEQDSALPLWVKS